MAYIILKLNYVTIVIVFYFVKLCNAETCLIFGPRFNDKTVNFLTRNFVITILSMLLLLIDWTNQKLKACQTIKETNSCIDFCCYLTVHER